MILELKGIYKEYQQGKMKVPVLKDVNFSMEEGEYVAIMGPSGSGKSYGNKSRREKEPANA